MCRVFLRYQLTANRGNGENDTQGRQQATAQFLSDLTASRFARLISAAKEKNAEHTCRRQE
jgi:hypothetical protein